MELIAPRPAITVSAQNCSRFVEWGLAVKVPTVTVAIEERRAKGRIRSELSTRSSLRGAKGLLV